jgi:hypothetical protein
MPARPPLGLVPEIVDHTDTRHRWDSVSAQDTPQQISFTTLRGTGFATLPGITLARDIKRDYVDIGLLHGVNLIGEDGSVAYEGRITAAPRSLDAGHSVVVQGAGWMAHAQDVQITYLGVDQDFGAWGEMPLNERVRLALASEDMSTQWSASGDGLTVSFPVGTLGANATAELWYIAPPGEKVAKLMYAGNNAGGAVGVGLLGASDSDSGPGDTYAPTLDGALHTQTFTDPRQFAYIAAAPRASTVIGAGWLRHFSRIAAYGDHGLTTRRALDPAMPDGLYVSDVIVDVFSRYCPMIDARRAADGGQVQQTTYPVGQLAYKDLITPFDLLLDANKWHLWTPAVWEDRKLWYGPADLTEAGVDWKVRTTESTVKIELQGDTADNLSNGIQVQFTNVANGRQEILSPKDYPELRDESIENPVNLHGYQKWTTLQLSFPCTADDALQLGRAALAEANQPTGSGSITVTGYIRDSAGHLQQTFKPRAGETIQIEDHPNSRPRLITETSYSHGQGNTPPSVTLALDSTMKRLDALFDRIATSQAAHNLS